jgi:hypothetical protein
MLTSPNANTISGGQPPVDIEMNFAVECRNVIRILSFTIDSLCEGHFEEDRKLSNIRSLISSLSTLESLADALEFRLAGVPEPDRMKDINGVHYIAVSTCELERFSAK